MRVADRVVEMRGGMIVADGKPEAVVARIMEQIKTTAA
jgi:ABC-type glutathione transport system ATPase component